MGLQEGIALYGEELIESWKSRVRYSEKQRKSEIEANLGFFPIWKADDQLAARDAELARRRAYDDSVRRANEAASANAEQTNLRNAITAIIHFDYDRSELRDDARATLDAKIPVLMANPDVNVRIAGNTDERGSVEYNIALGQRRAAAAKRYLMERGVTASRIETVSFGEGRPVADGHDESAWSQNRRDEFEITGGGARLARPRT